MNKQTKNNIPRNKTRAVQEKEKNKAVSKPIKLKHRKDYVKTGDRLSMTRTIGEIDRPFLMVVIALLCFGSVMVFSASYASAQVLFKDSFFFARSQMFYAISGFFLMIVAATVINYKIIRSLAWIGYGISLLLNLGVVFFGVSHNNAQRWLVLFGIEFQPSELLKFFIIVVCAAYASDNVSRMRTFKYGILPFLLIGSPALVILLLQNHLSALVIIFALLLSMYFLGGGSLAWLGGGFSLASFGVWAVLSLPFIKDIPIIKDNISHSFARLEVWDDPVGKLADPLLKDKAWQPAQSLYAIASGGFWGLGLGKSNQKHGFLPEPQNDYIFAILCEELGFFGAMIVVGLFAYFAYRGFYISKNAPNKFTSLLVMGIVIQVTLQAGLNIGVVSNLLPSTGISLPFFSYGGTALWILLVEIGVILSISKYSYQTRD